MTNGFLNVARFNHNAILLPNGQVLIAGGRGTNGILSSTEIYATVINPPQQLSVH